MMASHVINDGKGPLPGDRVHFYLFAWLRLPAKVVRVDSGAHMDLRVFGHSIAAVEFGTGAGQWMWRREDLRPVRMVQSPAL